MSVRRMYRRDHSSKDRIDATLGNERSFLGLGKNRQVGSTMTKDSRLSEPIDQGSNLHMAIKLLKAENSNLEKIIIILKTENQKFQTKMRELEYQNDRFKITQNQLKNELKRERDMVKYLHGLTKKHERTIQKKDAEYRQLRRETRESEQPENPPDLPEKNDRTEQPAAPELPPKREKNTEKTIDTHNLLTVEHIEQRERPTSEVFSPTTKTRPQPPKRSDSFNVKRNRPFIAPRGEKFNTNAYNSDSALTEAVTESSSLPRCKSSDNILKKKEANDKIVKTSTEDESSEWDDVLGFLNEKVNQFEKLLVETSGGSNSGSSSEAIEQGK